MTKKWTKKLGWPETRKEQNTGCRARCQRVLAAKALPAKGASSRRLIGQRRSVWRSALATLTERQGTTIIRPSAEAPENPQVWNVSGIHRRRSRAITWHEYVALCCPDADLVGFLPPIGEPGQSCLHRRTRTVK